MEPDDELPARRYVLLARELLAEPKATQRSVAKRLGVTQPSLNGYLADPPRQRPKIDKVLRAMALVPVDRDFFFDPDLGEEPSYRDHKPQTRVESDEPPNVHFVTFKRMVNLSALGVTPEELKHIERAPFRGGARSWKDYANALNALLRIEELPQPKGLLAAKARETERKAGKPRSK